MVFGISETYTPPQATIVSLLTYTQEEWDLSRWLQEMETEKALLSLDLLATPETENNYEHRWVSVILPSYDLAEKYMNKVQSKLHSKLLKTHYLDKKHATFGAVLGLSEYGTANILKNGYPKTELDAIKTELALTFQTFDYPSLENHFETLVTISAVIAKRIACYNH